MRPLPWERVFVPHGAAVPRSPGEAAWERSGSSLLAESRATALWAQRSEAVWAALRARLQQEPAALSAAVPLRAIPSPTATASGGQD